MRQSVLIGIAIALATAIALVVAGASPFLAIGMLILWSGTLWLTRGEPEAPAVEHEDEGRARQTVSQVIEPMGHPVLLLRNDRIILANALAREKLGEHIVGQDARIALRHPDAIRLLADKSALPASDTVVNFLGPRSLWQISAKPIDERHVLMELIDRTAEADIGRAHTDFVANASHELRTPLASIIGYVETLEDDADDQGKAAATRSRFLGIVLREARRLQALVEDLMALSRIEAEKHEAPTDQIDLAMIASTVATDMAALVGSERIETRITGPALIRGDERQVDQLIRNLVDNALKYGSEEQPVEIAVSRDSEWQVLAVTDHGEGIAAEHLPHLTRRFYRTDPGRSRAAGGTGLGLAIVKHIVERHRARLNITSELGHGTTMEVRFSAVKSGG